MLIRWAKNGPIACSYDGKRLFSAYRSGGIAVILDTNGNGSVMNPKGKCVLNLRLSDSNQVADVLSEEDGQLLSRHVKLNNSEDNGNEQIHQWNFQGLLISFSPSIWEVVLALSTASPHSDRHSIGKCRR
jgi:hypothetical protein